LICSPVLEIVSNSREFCEYMGFKVKSLYDYQMNEDNFLNLSSLVAP